MSVQGKPPEYNGIEGMPPLAAPHAAPCTPCDLRAVPHVVLAALARSIVSLASPRIHGIGPGLLPLLRHLHPNLQGVHCRPLQSLCIWPSLGRTHTWQRPQLRQHCSDAAIGDFSCSSHTSIMRSIVWICSLVMLCS